MGGTAEKGKREAGAKAAGEERQRGDPCIRRINSEADTYISSHTQLSHAQPVFMMNQVLNMHMILNAGLCDTVYLHL